MMGKSIYSIQNDALSNVRKDFEKAARDSRTAIRNHFEENFVRSPESLSDRLKQQMRFSKLESKLNALNFLQEGAKGQYRADSMTATELTVWYDYLHSLNKLTNGFNSYNTNKHTIEKLQRQNGPKKMQHRLERFLKRKISKRANYIKIG